MLQLRKIFLFLTLFAFGSAWAQEPTPAPTPDSKVEVDNELIPTVELIPPKEAWSLGVQQELVVVITHKRSVRVYFPQKPTIPGLLLHEVREKRQHLPDQKFSSTMSMVLVPVRLDVMRLPVLDVAWRSLNDPNQSGSVPVDLGRAMVRGQFTNPSDAHLGALPDGLNIRHRNMTLIMGLVALGAAIVAILLTLAMIVLLRKTTFRQTAPPIPPDVEALRALEDLRAQPEDLKNEPKRSVTRTSEILRRYLGRRYVFEALEATTKELVHHMEVLAPHGVSTLELDQLLRTMDMVKFAAQKIDLEQVQMQMDAVESLVKKSRENEEQRAARELQKRALLPAPSERALSLAVDLSLGGLLALVFHAAAIVTGRADFFIIALVVLGLWLLLRDFTARSPGKRLGRLRLVPSTSTAYQDPGHAFDDVPTLGARILRNLTLLPVVTLPAELLAGSLLPEQRRLGDLLCRTRVIRAHSGAEQPDPKLVWAAWLLASLLVLMPAFWAMSCVQWGGLS